MDRDYVQREISKNVLASQMLLFVEGQKPNSFNQIKLSESEYWRVYGFIMHSIIGNRTDTPIQAGKPTEAGSVIPYMTTDYEINVEDNGVRTFYNLEE